MMKLLFKTLVLCGALSAQALAQTNTKACDHWSAGGETPSDTDMRISHMIEVNTNIAHRGSTLTADGQQIEGWLRFEPFDQGFVPKIGPSVALAVVDVTPEYIAFSAPFGSYVVLEADDGRILNVQTGRLTDPSSGSDKLSRLLLPPLTCYREAGDQPLQQVTDDMAFARTLDPADPQEDFFLGASVEETPADPDRDLSGLFADGAGVKEVSDDASLANALASNAPAAEAEAPEEGLATLAARTDPVSKEEEIREIAADLGATDDGEAGAATEVCMLASDRVLTLETALSADIYAAGLVKRDVSLKSFTYEPLFDTLIDNEKQFAVIEGTGETLAPVAFNGFARYQVPGTGSPVTPVSLTGLIVTGSDVASLTPVPSEDVINVVVVGDAATVKAAGLVPLEEAARAKLGRIYWRVVWHDVHSDGTISQGQAFGSFADLVAALPDGTSPVFLSDPVQFGRFMSGFEDLALSSDDRIDQLYWIKEGYRLPHEAPQQISAAFRAINASGNVGRRDNGRPLKWLQVIAGQYAQPFSQYYVDGPVKTSNPEVGYMSVEPAGRERDVILTDLTYPQSSLEFLVRRRGLADGAAAVPSAPAAGAADVVLSQAEALSSSGYLIHQSLLDKMGASVGTTKTVVKQLRDGLAPDTIIHSETDLDVSALLWPKTTQDGALRDLTIDPVLIDRRIKTLNRVRPDLNIVAVFDALDTQIAQGRGIVSKKACDFVYVTMKDLNL